MRYCLFQIYDNGKFSAYVKKWCIGSEVHIRGPFGSLDYKQNKVMLSAEIYKYIKLMLLLRNEFNFWNFHGIMNTSGLFARDLKYC